MLQLGIPQAVRSFDLTPCSELRIDLRFAISPKQPSSARNQIPPVLTIKLEPRENLPINADWFGFSTNTLTGSASDSLTFRIGCVRVYSSSAAASSSSSSHQQGLLNATTSESSIALFTSSGCVATIEGPSQVVQRCCSYSFFDVDASMKLGNNSSSSSSSNSAAALSISVGGAGTGTTSDNCWPAWRRQVLQLHEFLHSLRLEAHERGKRIQNRNLLQANTNTAGAGGGEDNAEENNNQEEKEKNNNDEDEEEDDFESRLGPRVLICSSRPGSGKTTLCRFLLNLAVRDGFQPLLISADTTGTSLVGQPGCFSACFADHGIDPTESGAHYPILQVPVPLEDCERSKRSEPWKFSINSLMDLAEQRTLSVASCASGGFIVDTETVDEFASEDELDRILTVIDECNISYVLVVGSENLRNALRYRLMSSASMQEFLSVQTSSSGGGNSNASNESEAIVVRRQDDSQITLWNFPAVDGAVASTNATEFSAAAAATTGGGADNSASSSSSAFYSSSSISQRWYRYFFGTPTSPLSSWTHKLSFTNRSEQNKFVALKSLTSSSHGLLPLGHSGEEQASFFKAEAQPVDILTRFQQFVGSSSSSAAIRKNPSSSSSSSSSSGANQQKTEGKLLICAIMRTDQISSVTCSSDVIGFVGITNVSRESSSTSATTSSSSASSSHIVVQMISPCKSLPNEKHVFALMENSFQL